MEDLNILPLQRLLELRPCDRTGSYLSQIVAGTVKVAFFQSLSPEVHTACCKVMRLKQFAPGQIVFHKGDAGDSFCVILSGSVHVLIPSPSAVSLDSIRPVATLFAGQSFGELALLHNKERAATIQTAEFTSLAVLEKSDFARILHRIEETKLRNKFIFISSLKVFSGWPESQMWKLVYFFQESLYTKGQIVYKQGDLADKVYVSLSGEFEYRQEIEGIKQAVLAVIGSKELFGEREVVAGTGRENSCICASQLGKVYFILKEDFLRFYQRKSTVRWIKRVAEEEEKWLHQRKSQIIKAEEAKNSVNLHIFGEKGKFQHSELSLNLKENLKKFSNLSKGSDSSSARTCRPQLLSLSEYSVRLPQGKARKHRDVRTRKRFAALRYSSLELH